MSDRSRNVVDARGARRGAQLARTLRLIAALDHSWCSLPYLADHFAVTQRTIHRDIRFLQGHGFVIQERAYDITDDAKVQWKLEAWPARYDLTQASAQRPDAVDPSGAIRGNKVRRA